MMFPRGLRSLALLIREDWETNSRDWTQPGFRALAAHRFGTWVRNLGKGPLRTVLSRLHIVAFRYIRNHYSVELPATAKVGRRVVIAHQGGIVINGSTVIGDECLIRQNVTIGARNDYTVDEAPTLCRGVQVGCGAVILGRITVGEAARIGPNAVVTADVPAGATVIVERPRVLLSMTAGAAELLDKYGLSPADLPPSAARLRTADVQAFVDGRRLAAVRSGGQHLRGN